MNRTVQARLDDESYRKLRKLVRRMGVHPSEIVRRGIHLLESVEGEERGRVIGMGEFSSGIRDLGSNKERLRDFGK